MTLLNKTSAYESLFFLIYFCIFIFLWSFIASAQTKVAYYPLAQQISSENGLSQNVVLALEEDNLGRIWVGTQDGLNLRARSRTFFEHKLFTK